MQAKKLSLIDLINKKRFEIKRQKQVALGGSLEKAEKKGIQEAHNYKKLEAQYKPLETENDLLPRKDKNGKDITVEKVNGGLKVITKDGQKYVI